MVKKVAFDAVLCSMQTFSEIFTFFLYFPLARVKKNMYLCSRFRNYII